MEPTTLDPELLKSIGGIVTLTILIVQALKSALATSSVLARVPTAAYALAVACGLTWLAHDVLHWLDGNLVDLLAQTVIETLLAFGLLTMRTWNKPIGESAVAAERRGTP